MGLFAAASFFFAVAESALFSLGKRRAQELAHDSPLLGKQVLEMLEEPQDLLATIVLGNTFANGALIATGLWLAAQGVWPLWLALAVLFLTILIGGEVIPKTLAVRSPEQWAQRVAGPMRLIQRFTRPLRRVAQGLNGTLLRAVTPSSIKPQTQLTEAEYHELLDMAIQQGTLGQSEREIILQIISLDQRTAKDVMKPRARMAMIRDDLSIEEMIEVARQSRHRRLPMYDQTPDTIVGVLNTTVLLLDPDHDLAEAIEFPSFVPESMNLMQLFKSLQRQKRGLAIVMDEFGGTAGLVTLEDILEETMGGFHSENEEKGFIMQALEPGRWRVNGAMRLEDFRREYPDLGQLPEVDTMGGLLVSLCDVVPASGQSATFRGLRLTAQVVEERRVRELLVELVKK